MLDRKIKDIDANDELLLDRKDSMKTSFFVFFIIGWSCFLGGLMVISSSFFMTGIVISGIGLSFLIFSTWFFNSVSYYNILLKINQNKKEE